MPKEHISPRRYAVLTEGYLSDPTACKTAFGVMRFRPEEIAVVVDSRCLQEGETVQNLFEMHCHSPSKSAFRHIAAKPARLIENIALSAAAADSTRQVRNLVLIQVLHPSGKGLR